MLKSLILIDVSPQKPHFILTSIAYEVMIFHHFFFFFVHGAGSSLPWGKKKEHVKQI